MKRLLISLFLCGELFAQGLAQKTDVRILYVGWGSPKLTALNAENIAQYEEAAPFDGLLFFFGTSDVMNPKVRYDYEHHALPNVKKYQAIPFKRFKHNFAHVLIDQNKIDWFDDKAWEVISNNWAVTARAARECGLDGIAFDPECNGVYPVTSYWRSNTIWRATTLACRPTMSRLPDAAGGKSAWPSSANTPPPGFSASTSGVSKAT